MTSDSHRDLQVLEAVARDQRITQRRLAKDLGIALGLSNLYLRRLAKKGYIKCVGAGPNRLQYLLTPTGVAEKMRLTYEFMEYSLSLYRQVREHLRERLQPLVHLGPLRIGICGTGEAAELAYLSLKEFDVEPAAIFDDGQVGRFLGLPVSTVSARACADCEIIIAASLDRQDEMVAHLVEHGVPLERIVTLRASALRADDRPEAGA